jgi:hypothetical protein
MCFVLWFLSRICIVAIFKHCAINMCLVLRFLFEMLEEFDMTYVWSRLCRGSIRMKTKLARWELMYTWSWQSTFWDVKPSYSNHSSVPTYVRIGIKSPT